MPTFTEAQLMEWLSPVLWPFLRVLGLFTTSPVFSSRGFPVRARIGLALLVAFSAQATLGAQPIVSLDGAEALDTLLQQVGIGMTIGFAVRLVFAAVELAGEVIGLQMGLNFAAFFDPTSNAQVSAVSRFMGNVAALVFLAVNGHLLVLMAVIKSFDTFPVGGGVLDAFARLRMHELGADLFSSALWIALPMIGLLLFVNLALGIISRVAPQMNIYAIGFPITLTAGLGGLCLFLTLLEQPLVSLMSSVIQTISSR